MLDSLRSETHNKFLAIQRIARFTQTCAFEDAVELASSEEIENIRICIDEINYVRLRKIVKDILTDSLENKTVKQLRHIARREAICGWYLMDKVQLLSALRGINA